MDKAGDTLGNYLRVPRDPLNNLSLRPPLPFLPRCRTRWRSWISAGKDMTFPLPLLHPLPPEATDLQIACPLVFLSKANLSALISYLVLEHPLCLFLNCLISETKIPPNGSWNFLVTRTEDFCSMYLSFLLLRMKARALHLCMQGKHTTIELCLHPA